MHAFIFSPFVAFLLMLAVIFVLNNILSRLAFKNSKKTAGKGKAYACGEDIPSHLAQPDYSQFFPYAFFFTIAHVATLIITTVPVETVRVLAMALMYILTVVIGLYVLLRS